ncbi:MAG: hypothetical protein ACFFD4_25590 [Candidatus Odinarchaeota archaeon]
MRKNNSVMSGAGRYFTSSVMPVISAPFNYSAIFTKSSLKEKERLDLLRNAFRTNPADLTL